MPDKIKEYRKQHPEQKDLFHFVDDVKIEEKQSIPDKNTSWKVQKITESLNSLLQYKNHNYGDSISRPINIFSKLDSYNGITTRLDDKISRVMNSSELRKNDIADILGYLVLLCAQKDWISFEEFKD